MPPGKQLPVNMM